MKTHDQMRRTCHLCAKWLMMALLLSIISVPQAVAQWSSVSDLQSQIDAAGYHWTAGITSFSGMSDEDLRKYTGRIKSTDQDPDIKTMTFSPTILGAAQWPTTIPKDQGLCGACWAYASVGALETVSLAAGAAPGCLDLSV
jgi:hypothetical protein